MLALTQAHAQHLHPMPRWRWSVSINMTRASCGPSLSLCLLQSISICFFTETWRPDSFYDKIASNRRAGLHTLCLLDIKVSA